jgi:hypothetical protein
MNACVLCCVVRCVVMGFDVPRKYLGVVNKREYMTVNLSLIVGHIGKLGNDGDRFFEKGTSGLCWGRWGKRIGSDKMSKN